MRLRLLQEGGGNLDRIDGLPIARGRRVAPRKLGGATNPLYSSRADPLFFAHHTMIDRLWYLWQVRNGNGGFPADLLDEPLMPLNKSPRDVLDVQGLGYEVAASAVAIPVPATAPSSAAGAPANG